MIYNMEEIISSLISNFDWAYMLTVNILTYIIIKVIDYLNKDKEITTLIKRIVLISCIILLAIIYKITSDVDNRILINSAILAPVAWDFIFKPIIKKIGIDYKKRII